MAESGAIVALKTPNSAAKAWVGCEVWEMSGLAHKGNRMFVVTGKLESVLLISILGRCPNAS